MRFNFGVLVLLELVVWLVGFKYFLCESVLCYLVYVTLAGLFARMFILTVYFVDCFILIDYAI